MPAIIPAAIGIGTAIAGSAASAGISAATKGGGGGSAPQPQALGVNYGAESSPTPVNDMPSTVAPAPDPNTNPDELPHLAGGGTAGGNRWGRSQRGGWGPNAGYNGGAAPIPVGPGAGSPTPGNPTGGDPYAGNVNPYTLGQRGYEEFQPGASPDVNQLFQGYTPSQTQQNAEMAQEQQLADTLRARSQGIGPSVAQQQLTDATSGNMANSMGLLAASRNTPGGLAAALAANAAAGQGSAGQSATIRAGEEQNATGQLGNELGAIAEQQQQVNLANTGAENQAAEFNASDRAALANMLQNQYQFRTGIGENEQDRRNAAIAAGMGLDQGESNTLLNTGVNAGIQGGSGLLNAGGNYLAQSSQGNPNPGSTNPTNTYDNTGGQGGSQDFSGNYNYNGPQLQAKGTVAPNGPEEVIIGEAGPEAVVPINEDGTASLERTKDPHVRALLTHPDFLKALHEVVGSGDIMARDKQLSDYMAQHGAPGGYNPNVRRLAGGGVSAEDPELEHPLTMTVELLHALAGLGGPTGATQEGPLHRRLAAEGAPGGYHG